MSDLQTQLDLANMRIARQDRELAELRETNIDLQVRIRVIENVDQDAILKQTQEALADAEQRAYDLRLEARKYRRMANGMPTG
jgi:hypothetical protein